MFHVKQFYRFDFKWWLHCGGSRLFIPIYTEIFKSYTEVIPRLYTEPCVVVFHVKHYGGAGSLYDSIPRQF